MVTDPDAMAEYANATANPADAMVFRANLFMAPSANCGRPGFGRRQQGPGALSSWSLANYAFSLLLVVRSSQHASGTLPARTGKHRNYGESKPHQRERRRF